MTAAAAKLISFAALAITLSMCENDDCGCDIGDDGCVPADVAEVADNIDYSLNVMEQDDPRLIEAIRERFLMPPPPDPKKRPRRLAQKATSAKALQGQHGQPHYVDSLFK